MEISRNFRYGSYTLLSAFYPTGKGFAKDAANVLLRYLRWMEFWKKFYKPESVEEEWHPLFDEAIQNEIKISYLVDMLMFGTDEEILDFSRTEGRR